jgi:hypothetical protein
MKAGLEWHLMWLDGPRMLFLLSTGEDEDLAVVREMGGKTVENT